MKVTWTFLFKITAAAILVQPFLIAAGLSASTRDNFDDIPHNVFGYIEPGTLRFFYLLYIGRFVVPALIYMFKPSNKSRGMLTHALSACFLFELLIACIALSKLLANHANEGFESLGSDFAIMGLIAASLLAQVIGMIVGAVRGFEKQAKI